MYKHARSNPECVVVAGLTLLTVYHHVARRPHPCTRRIALALTFTASAAAASADDSSAPRPSDAGNH